MFSRTAWSTWWYRLQSPIILHDNAKSHTAAAVTDLLRRSQWEILEHPPYSRDMSPCDYDHFAKVKVRVTRYNTIQHGTTYPCYRAIKSEYQNRWTLWWCTTFPNIRQKVINKGVTILKVCKCCIPVNKATSEISNYCHYFLSNPCSCKISFFKSSFLF